jgi:asparagine synthase (glutamine-hydrolysing)
MCGILGIIPASFSVPYFTQALDSLTHRGPDGGDVWFDTSKVMLGHRRLSILDLTDKGKQPMIWQDRFVVTFNGEIYNYLEIRKELESKGLRFYTGTDTEVLVAAYAQWGPECLKYFNGMWACGIWDKEENSLFLARDRFGVKPLFYSHAKGQLVFASEMKAIIPFLAEQETSTDWQWCYQNQHDYEGTSKTLIKDVLRFPAGHYAKYVLGTDKIQWTKYWDTLDGLERNTLPYQDQVEGFKAVFQDACKIRIMADVPVATALSGGIDSSVISATLNSLQNRHVVAKEFQVFTASFPGAEELDETVYAQAVANHLQIPIHKLVVDSSFEFESLKESIWKFEELYLTTPLPMMGLYRQMAEKGYKVSIDGHAGDELFAGYGHAIFQIVKDRPYGMALIKQLISTYKAMYAQESHQDFIHLVDAFGGRKNLGQFYLNALLGKTPKEIPSLDHFNNYLYLIFHKTILPTLLRNYDRYSMAAGVEVRMPFLDYRVVKYAFGLGWEAKVRNGYTKAIVRDAFANELPKEVITRRKKVGFSSPMNKWFEYQWNSVALDIVHSKSFLESKLIPSPLMLQTQLIHLLRKKDLTFQEGAFVWNSLQPYLWEEYFFKRAKKISA